jgi:myo-inositol-1(or 4)-monophosphatase
MLRGSRFWPDDNQPDSLDHRAAPLGTEVLP